VPKEERERERVAQAAKMEAALEQATQQGDRWAAKKTMDTV